MIMLWVNQLFLRLSELCSFSLWQQPEVKKKNPNFVGVVHVYGQVPGLEQAMLILPAHLVTLPDKFLFLEIFVIHIISICFDLLTRYVNIS